MPKDWTTELARFIFEILFVFILVKFGYKSKIVELELEEYLVDKIVDNYKPDDLIDGEFDDESNSLKNVNFNCGDYDFFNLANLHKEEIKDVIKKYGIGSCGPRGFYGTLDLHVELESKIASIFNTDDAILYSNSFTCISSIMICFCKSNDLVYYHKDCNESILRGITVLKSTCFEFRDIIDLDKKIKSYKGYRKRIFVLIEGLFKNTGEVINIIDYISLKQTHKFRIILDESFSFPLLGKQGVSSYYNTKPQDIDIIIGSLAHVLCANGAFATGTTQVVEYQRINSISYCFSASMPGFLAKYALCNLEIDFDLLSLQEKVKLFHSKFSSKNYYLSSPIDSPLITIRGKVNIDEDLCKQLRKNLEDNSIRISFIEQIETKMRIILKQNFTDENIVFIADTISGLLV